MLSVVPVSSSIILVIHMFEKQVLAYPDYCLDICYCGNLCIWKAVREVVIS